MNVTDLGLHLTMLRIISRYCIGGWDAASAVCFTNSCGLACDWAWDRLCAGGEARRARDGQLGLQECCEALEPRERCRAGRRHVQEGRVRYGRHQARPERRRD